MTTILPTHNIFKPWIIYENLKEYCNYGNMELKSEFTEEQMKKLFQATDFIQIDAHDNRNDRTVYILLFNTMDRIVDNKKSAQFKDILISLPPGDKEVIIITDELIKNPLRNNILNIGSASNGLRIRMFTYIHFKMVLPRGPGVDPHEIIPAKDVPQLLQDLCVSMKKELPKIRSSDPQASWIRAKVGDVIKITRSTETTLTAPYYRICIRDKADNTSPGYYS